MKSKEGMKCHICGTRNRNDAHACSACGSPLGTGVVVIKEDDMKNYFFMESVLPLISRGDISRKAFAISLRVLAVMVTAAGFVCWISGWKYVARPSVAMVAGIIIFQLLFALALYMVTHTLLIRARDIAELPETEFTLIPIGSIFLKLVGEVYASFVAVMSVAGGILIWFIGGQASYLLKKSSPLPFVPNLGGGHGFWGGVLFMAAGLFAAFFALAFFYFLAEVVVVMADTAKNIKIMRHTAEKYDKK